MSAEIDILKIDEKIKRIYSEEEKKIPEYSEKLTELKKSLSNVKDSFKNKKIIFQFENNIKILEEKIEKISLQTDLNFYISETADILSMYDSLLKIPIKVSFTGRTKTNDREKKEIIEKYISVAQKYTDISCFLEKKDIKFKMTCNNCQNKRNFIVQEHIYICSDCGAQEELMQQVTSYKDTDRVNISTKYTYDRKVHFRDCINQYQGKQNCTIDQEVYDNLEETFSKYNLLIGDKNTPKEVRFSRVTKNQILMFLKQLKYNKHYENVTLIHYNLTGQKPDDITYLEEKLLGDFDLMTEVYDKKFKNKTDRVNFISSQYVLFQLLRKYKHPCKKEDFIMLKTSERKAFHDNICRELFLELGWSFIPLV